MIKTISKLQQQEKKITTENEAFINQQEQPKEAQKEIELLKDQREKQKKGDHNISPTVRCPLPGGFFDSTTCDKNFTDHGAFLNHLNVFHGDSTSTTTIAGKMLCPLCTVDIINMAAVTGLENDELASDSLKLRFHLTSSCKSYNKQ